MTAREVFDQKNGKVTQSYYEVLDSRGPLGRIATALFRAQKRSNAAKEKNYRPRHRREAYYVKEWSLGQACDVLARYGRELGFRWGWKEDPNTRFGEEASWVLYVDLREGQVSFHSPSRGAGPAYPGEWDGQRASEERILRFCDAVMEGESKVQSDETMAVCPICGQGVLASQMIAHSATCQEGLYEKVAAPAVPMGMLPRKLVFGDPASIMLKRQSRKDYGPRRPR